jgi:hypothetical protein
MQDVSDTSGNRYTRDHSETAISAAMGILQRIKDDTVREMLLKQMKALV